MTALVEERRDLTGQLANRVTPDWWLAATLRAVFTLSGEVRDRRLAEIERLAELAGLQL